VVVLALLAVTLNVAELPAVMELGRAAMVTVGCGSRAVPLVDPHPAAIRRRKTVRPGANQLPQDLRKIKAASADNARSTFQRAAEISCKIDSDALGASSRCPRAPSNAKFPCPEQLFAIFFLGWLDFPRSFGEQAASSSAQAERNLQTRAKSRQNLLFHGEGMGIASQ
jgi:hypothetical protein